MFRSRRGEGASFPNYAKDMTPDNVRVLTPKFAEYGREGEGGREENSSRIPSSRIGINVFISYGSTERRYAFLISPNIFALSPPAARRENIEIIAGEM